MIRRRWWLVVLVIVGAWVLSTSRPGSRVLGCPTGCAVPRDSSPAAGKQSTQTLKVMSLNMLHGFPRFEHLSDRLDLIAMEINRQEADIVCLQEVPWTVRLGNGARYLAEQTGMNHAYLRANGNRWAILFEEGEVRTPSSAEGHSRLTCRCCGRFRHPSHEWRSRRQSSSGASTDGVC